MEDSPFWLKLIHDPAWQFVGALLALAILLVSWWWFSRKKDKSLTYELGVIVPLLSVERGLRDKVKILYEDQPVQDVYLVTIKLVTHLTQRPMKLQR